jgi:hypothetical protein
MPEKFLNGAVAHNLVGLCRGYELDLFFRRSLRFIWRALKRVTLPKPLQCLSKQRIIQRLDQVRVESSLACPCHILGLPIAGQRHQLHAFAGRRFSDELGESVAVHVRKADVEQCHIGLKRFQPIDCFSRTTCRKSLVSLDVEEQNERVRCICIVIDDQYAPGRHFAPRDFRTNARRTGDQRQPDFECRSVTDARAVCVDPTTMHFDQALYDRQANAQSALGPIERAITLYKEVEDPRQQLGCNACSGVRNLDDRTSLLAARLNQDLAAGIRIFGRIRQYVHHALLEAGKVTVDVQGPEARSDRHGMLLFVEQRLHGLERLRNDGRDLNGSLSEVDSA